MRMQIDETEIRRCISVLHPGELFEIRFLGTGKLTYSGYFDDADALIEELKHFSPKEEGQFYIGLNVINEACRSRQQYGKFVMNPKNTTSDKDITDYKWLLVDLDPKRPSGVSSSNEELHKAHLKACNVFAYLEQKGFEPPVVAMSGNGYHLLYRVNNPNTELMQKTVKKILETLGIIFTDDSIDIDKTVSNPARICKLYGTVAAKGQNTDDRPHRMSRLIKVPEEIRINATSSVLMPFAEEHTEPELPQEYNSYSPNDFNLEEFFVKHGITYTSKITSTDATKYILDCCPFDASHKGKDAAVFQLRSGRLGFKCLHSSCSDKGWKEFRAFYEPSAYEKSNRREDRKLLPRPARTIPTEETQLIYSAKDVFAMPKIQTRYIKTGIPRIDKLVGGLQLGRVSLLSGLRGCGKSSVLSQICLQAIQQGEKVFMYSGELTARNVCSWLTLQAAGKSHTHKDTNSDIQDKYEVDSEVMPYIEKWISDKVYIYNNDCLNRYEDILEASKRAIEDFGCSLVLLDNLMTIDIQDLDRDIFVRQSIFVGELMKFAKEMNVHIVFVAHPRKAAGFLRLDDVSGSNDIVNRVDNAFICHRINLDFRTQTKHALKWTDANPLLGGHYTNCIEICKDRENGTQDEWCGLVYEKESKRLNTFDGPFYTRYAWEEDYNYIPTTLFTFKGDENND